MERTLSIIKPDAVANGHIGDVIKRFESAGIKVVAMKMIQMTKAQAEKFYAEHDGRPFFEDLTKFMASGPIVPLALEGDDVILRNRELMGATMFKDAEPGTIRKDFGTGEAIEKNVVHGSDSPESAQREIDFFFNSFEKVT